MGSWRQVLAVHPWRAETLFHILQAPTLTLFCNMWLYKESNHIKWRGKILHNLISSVAYILIFVLLFFVYIGVCLFVFIAVLVNILTTVLTFLFTPIAIDKYGSKSSASQGILGARWQVNGKNSQLIFIAELGHKLFLWVLKYKQLGTSYQLSHSLCSKNILLWRNKKGSIRWLKGLS